MDQPPPFRRVGPDVVRRLFNSGDFWGRARRGELNERVLADRHPTSPQAPEPVCTRSMIVAYSDPSGQRVAIVHQYLRTDGTLGVSGRPDPKWVFYEGIIYEAQ